MNSRNWLAVICVVDLEHDLERQMGRQTEVFQSHGHQELWGRITCKTPRSSDNHIRNDEVPGLLFRSLHGQSCQDFKWLDWLKYIIELIVERWFPQSDLVVESIYDSLNRPGSSWSVGLHFSLMSIWRVSFICFSFWCSDLLRDGGSTSRSSSPSMNCYFLGTSFMFFNIFSSVFVVP